MAYHHHHHHHDGRWEIQNTALRMPGASIGMQNAPVIKDKIYAYDGQGANFQQTVKGIGSQSNINQVRSASITLIGEQLNTFSCCCLVMTIIFGAILIFPFLFMCCNWWKKTVYPTYNMSITVYQSLENVLRLPNLKNLTLVVTDNAFGTEKIDLLYEMLSKSRIQSFTFVNFAGMFNHGENEYSDFQEKMKKLKTLKMATDFRWHHEVVK